MTGGLFLLLTIAVMLLTVPYVWRLVAGPTLYDRVQGLNAVGSIIPLLLVLTGLLYGRVDMFVDLALALFLLNIVTTLLVARHARPKERGGRT